MDIGEVISAGPVVTVVRAAACHYCDDARAGLEELAAEHAIRVALIEASSPEGVRLVAAHSPAMFPLVLLDGEFFSAGRLPRRKLHRRLDQTQRAGAR